MTDAGTWTERKIRFGNLDRIWNRLEEDFMWGRDANPGLMFFPFQGKLGLLDLFTHFL